MDYIRELDALYHFMLRKKMPKSELALLLALYMINNAEDWVLWFEADNELLGRLTGGYSRETLNEARNGLKQKGRIDFRPGNRNAGSAKYRIVPFSGISDMKADMKADIKPDEKADIKPEFDMKPDIKTDIKADIKPDENPGIKPDFITNPEQGIDKKLNNNLNKKTPPKPPVEHFEEFMEAYPNKQRRGLAAKAYCDLMLSGTVTEEELLAAARNYAESCREAGTEGRFVKFASNFLQECIFEDFLPGRYTAAPASRRKPDANRGLMRSDYGDIASLEDALAYQEAPDMPE